MEKTTEKKLTKVEKFTMLKAIPGVVENPMLIEFIDHEIDLLSKKNSGEKKPTKTQLANETLKAEILEGMESGKDYTVTDVQKNVIPNRELSNQKVSVLLRQMADNHLVERIEEKRKAYYHKVEG